MEAIPELITTQSVPDEHMVSQQQSSRRFVAYLVVLTLILVFSTSYMINVFKDNNPFAPRPTEGALSAQEIYQELVQTDDTKLDGTGIKVCIVDSGIDMTHKDLSRLELAGWQDFVNNQDQPYDDQGHGTSMAGLLVADGWMQGVASDVDLYVAKALSGNGSGDDGDGGDGDDGGGGNNNGPYSHFLPLTSVVIFSIASSLQPITPTNSTRYGNAYGCG